MVTSRLCVFGAVLCSVLLLTVNAQDDRCEAPIDLVFLIDASGSICDNDPTDTTIIVDGERRRTCSNWGLVRDFMSDVADQLTVSPQNANVAAVLFANSARVLWDLDAYDNSRDLDAALQDIVYSGGNTNASGAFRVTMNEIFETGGAQRDRIQNLAIVITDGKSTRDPERTVTDAEALRGEPFNTLIYAVGVTDEVDRDELRDISSEPQIENRNYFTSPDFESLTIVIDALVDEACPPVTTPIPTEPPIPGCDEEMDVVFLIDTSGSIRRSNFGSIRSYLSDVINQLDVESGRIRVGLLTFATDIRLIFHLEDYDTRAEMRAIVEDESEFVYTRGTTNTAEAINYARRTMFTSGNGDRRDVPNLIIILTDGGSDDKDETITEALEAKTNDIHIITIGVGKWIDEYELRSIASHPWQSHLWSVENFQELDDFIDESRDAICNNVNECSSSPCRNGGDCIDSINMFWCQCEDDWGGQRCEYRCTDPADVVFSLDSSGSIKKENFQLMVDFTKRIAMELPIDEDTRIGMQTYADNTRVYFNLNDHESRLAIINAMSLPYFSGGTTDTAEALRVLREQMFTSSNGDRGSSPNVAIIMTDGRSNNAEETWSQARDTRDDDIEVLAIGVGGNARPLELRGMATDPVDSNVYSVNSFSDLDDVFEDLREAICNTEDECDSGPCRNGGNCVDERNGFHCECREDFTGRTCERRCSGDMDVVFIIDRSGSIRSNRFEAVKEFFVSIINEMEVYRDKIRIGAITFDDTAETVFYMNSYDSKQDAVHGIRRISYQGGRTNIASALRLARREHFTSSRGDRDDVPNYLIVFTDGNANIDEGNTIPEAIDTRIAGIHIINVAVGRDIDFLELRSIASDPVVENVFSVDTFADLNTIAPVLLQAVCDDIDECDSDPCQNGGTCADGLNKYVCVCPSDRTGENCNLRCDDETDVAFILDFSGSVEDTYNRMITFVKRLVQGMEFRFDQTRMALVSFSDSARVDFLLDAYQDKQDVLNALSFNRNGGRTNTQEALRLVRDEVFDGGNGDRRSVDDKLVLITDGGSNINPQQTRPRAEDLKDDGVEIYVVAVGDNVDRDEIQDIASGSTQPWITQLSSDGDIDTVTEILLEELCGN